MRRVGLILLLALAACGGGGSDGASPRAVLRWNEIAQRVAGVDHERVHPDEDPRITGWQFGPTRTSRAFAIVQIAVADAVATISGTYAPYLPTTAPRGPCGLDAAVAQAAHDALAALYPMQTAAIDADLDAALARLPDDRASDCGRDVGATTAAAILAARAHDGSEFQTPFQPVEWVYGDQPGVWRADPTTLELKPLTPRWGRVRPFVIASGAAFRAPPPPALDSVEYAAAFAEVQAFGGDGLDTPTERSADQTVAAIYWAYDGQPFLCAPVKLYNQIAVHLARQEQLDAAASARLLALANVAMADAAIALWESKSFYQLWRPVTGIRESDAGSGPSGLGDGNRLTVGDPNWTPLGAPAAYDGLPLRNFTPPFPAYPSGHAGFGGALFEVLRAVLGRDDVPFTFVSDELDGATIGWDGRVRQRLPRHFDRLSQAEEENGQSRIWLGVHWAFDKTAGLTQGRAIADQVVATLYQPDGR
ncbi:MAG: vanadium-dependent haloperoxidase [Deltaproteobacteria bacterium]|nr:vanadium-dependent haloperoxidase [Deltaproteobacteria bacterium]